MARLQLTVHESIIPDIHMLALLVLDSMRPNAPPKRLWLSGSGHTDSHRVKPATDADLPADDAQFESSLHRCGSRLETTAPLSTPATPLQPAKRATWVSSLASCKSMRQPSLVTNLLYAPPCLVTTFLCAPPCLPCRATPAHHHGNLCHKHQCNC